MGLHKRGVSEHGNMLCRVENLQKARSDLLQEDKLGLFGLLDLVVFHL